MCQVWYSQCHTLPQKVELYQIRQVLGCRVWQLMLFKLILLTLFCLPVKYHGCSDNHIIPNGRDGKRVNEWRSHEHDVTMAVCEQQHGPCDVTRGMLGDPLLPLLSLESPRGPRLPPDSAGRQQVPQRLHTDRALPRVRADQPAEHGGVLASRAERAHQPMPLLSGLRRLCRRRQPLRVETGRSIFGDHRHSLQTDGDEVEHQQHDPLAGRLRLHLWLPVHAHRLRAMSLRPHPAEGAARHAHQDHSPHHRHRSRAHLRGPLRRRYEMARRLHVRPADQPDCGRRILQSVLPKQWDASQPVWEHHLRFPAAWCVRGRSRRLHRRHRRPAEAHDGVAPAVIHHLRHHHFWFR